MSGRVNIAIVDNYIEYAEARRAAIESKTDWPAIVTTEIFTNADDLIDAFDKQGKFFDIIFTDVFMPERGEDPRKPGLPETGAIRIKSWLQSKRETDDDFKYVQLRWISRQSDVSPFIHQHVNYDTYSWLQWISHHEKKDFLTVDFLMQVETAIRMVLPSNVGSETSSNMVIASPAMEKVVKEAGQLAGTESSVLILGESGTGKEELARFIHQNSPRADKKFVPYNCAGIPESLAESDLFGHEKGAFTGAVTQRKGLFEAANQGTLFLDEIGDMPLSLQAKILRVIQEREFYPLGRGIDQPARRTDFRLLSATNKDLIREITEGNFREDLFYRINVFITTLPPLRERPEDIVALSKHFLLREANRNNKGLISISQPVLDSLTRYAWPGNVRELKNVIERAAVFLSLNGELELEHLPEHLQPHNVIKNRCSPLSPQERIYYSALKDHNFNIPKAASYLEKSRQALHKYIHDTDNTGAFLHSTLKRLYDEGKAATERERKERSRLEQASPLPSVRFKIEENF
jgi:DNA-binding NtrC family response regulator